MTINQTFRGAIFMTSGNVSVTATISTVNTAKCQLRYGGISGSISVASYNRDARVELTNSTTITALKVGTSQAINLNYDLTEWA